MSEVWLVWTDQLGRWPIGQYIRDSSLLFTKNCSVLYIVSKLTIIIRHEYLFQSRKCICRRKRQIFFLSQALEIFPGASKGTNKPSDWRRHKKTLLRNYCEIIEKDDYSTKMWKKLSLEGISTLRDARKNIYQYKEKYKLKKNFSYE